MAGMTPEAGISQTPERTHKQRMEALSRANRVRSERARLKENLKKGESKIADVLEEPPAYVHTAKVFDLLMAVPQCGRVRTINVLERCRVSPSKTVIGLTPRQRGELVDCLRAVSYTHLRAHETKANLVCRLL